MKNLEFRFKIKFRKNNYDTNKVTNFLVNDFNWNSRDLILR